MTFFSTAGEDLDRRAAVRHGRGEADAARGARLLPHGRAVLQPRAAPVRTRVRIVREGEHFVVRSQTPRGDTRRCSMQWSWRPGISGHRTSCTCRGSRCRTSPICITRGTTPSAVTSWWSVAVILPWMRARSLALAARKVTLVHFREHLDENVKTLGAARHSRTVSRNGSIGEVERARHPHRRGYGHDRRARWAAGPPCQPRLSDDRVYSEHGLLQQLGVSIDPTRASPRTTVPPWRRMWGVVFVAGDWRAGYDANKVFIENGRGTGVLIARRLVPAGRSPLTIAALTPRLMPSSRPDVMDKLVSCATARLHFPIVGDLCGTGSVWDYGPTGRRAQTQHQGSLVAGDGAIA